MMSDNNNCVIHTEKLTDIETKVTAIYTALMGTLEKEGFISNTNNRLKSLESFKKTQDWISKITVGTFITLIVGSLWFLLTGMSI